MADSPPPGYSGGSILPAPSQPVEMRVFQGGGGMEGGAADSSILPQPDHRIPLTEFRGGGVSLVGGRQKERAAFEAGLNTYKQTEFYKRFADQSLPNRANAGLYIIDPQGRVCVFRRSDNKYLTAPGGAVDATDKNFRKRPAILAALREAKEEVGINIFNIRNFIALPADKYAQLEKAIEDFIPIWNSGGIECFIYLLKRDSVIKAAGPDKEHEGEVDMTYTFPEFGTNKDKILKQGKGVAWIDIEHLIDTIQANRKSRLAHPFYIKFFKILNIIQQGGDLATMEAALAKQAPPGAKSPAPKKSFAIGDKVRCRIQAKIGKDLEGTFTIETINPQADGKIILSGKNDKGELETYESIHCEKVEKDEKDKHVRFENNNNNSSVNTAESVGSEEEEEEEEGEGEEEEEGEGEEEVSEPPPTRRFVFEAPPDEEEEPPVAQPRAPPPKTDIETNKLSNGLVVRIMPEDDSLKPDIQAFKFTGDEKVLFEETMHFKHPFFKQYLAQNKEDFYEFWKLYTTYDGTDQYTLMTHEEGRKVQKFMKRALDAFREYLMGAALPFLLKQEKPDLLLALQQPPDPDKYALMETILVPKAPEPPEEPPAAPPVTPPEEPPEEPPGGEGGDEEEEADEENNNVSIVNNNNDEDYTGNENEEDRKQKERKKKLFEKLNIVLQGNISKLRGMRKIFEINKKVREILDILDEISNYKVYKSDYSNSVAIGKSSFDAIHRTDIDKFLVTKVKPSEGLTDFLRKFVKINISQLDRKSKDQFHSFFLRIIDPKSTADFYEYVYGKKPEKETT